VQPEPAPNEEQLAFKLTSFDDESDKGDKS
jgi:hypothetical protein